MHLAALLALPLLAPAQAHLTLDGNRIVGPIDERVYGHFFEHIYHSANGGLWGELVWSRSFEDDGGAGSWSVADQVLRQTSQAPNVRLLFGDPTWRDYEFTCEARKTAGAEGFLVLFRATSPDDFYWANLGGWGNQRHRLEKGQRGVGRWGGVGESASGSIAGDRWYRLKVRCEGPRVTVSLDDQRVLDYSDPDRPHLAGQVGLGTWLTAAEFRHLRVTGLDGQVLLDGPPAVLGPAVGKGWEGWGQGQFECVSGGALNGQHSQRIAPAAGAEAGIRQEPFALARRETYRGSLWAKGVGAQVVVRLKDRERVLAETAPAAVGTAWTELPIVLQPTAACSEATLEIGIRGGPAWVDQVSLLADSARRAGGFRPDLLQAVAALKPPLIRWPGGCFAEHYHWRDAVGPQHQRVQYPINIWDDQDVNSLGTDEFIDLCRRVGSEPMLVINIGRHQDPGQPADLVKYAQDWVEYCNGPTTSPMGQLRAANGHPQPYGVKYWEIDNETWSMGTAAYNAAVQRFVPALKAIDPTIVIAVCGSGGFNSRWNQEVLDGCAKLADWISIHHYEGPDNFAEGPRRYERFFVELGEQIAKSKNPRLGIFVSEWNAQSTDWRTGLYAGGLLNAFERVPAVQVGSPALFLRHTSATDWDNAFINFDQTGWFAAPNYAVMQLYREHYEPQRIALEGDLTRLNAVATRAVDGSRVVLKVVNPSNQAVDVVLHAKAAPGRPRLTLLAPDFLAARNTLRQPHLVKPEPAPVQREVDRISFRLPRWAVGVLEVRR
ncbi:MAG: DUF1080 domain-containing protein [Fimbriimonadaceae bacterium]|nr:DUF1080 domain-containing protein [Fimbriimonadaceae bacterium]